MARWRPIQRDVFERLRRAESSGVVVGFINAPFQLAVLLRRTWLANAFRLGDLVECNFGFGLGSGGLAPHLFQPIDGGFLIKRVGSGATTFNRRRCHVRWGMGAV